ncbi:hypothetical protein CY35_U003100 [Sphagnum magellanicum]|uniref:Ribosomal protein L34e superfamily protein n=1 Tax=Sphagnum magellanicum TaxID=128215 RepID=A0AAD4QIC5_9BRYO|nr:hypothetical protein CY35_U003100 [Sphagnum magellanicum]
MVDCRGWGSLHSALEYHHSMANTLTVTDQIMVHSQKHQHQHQHQRLGNRAFLGSCGFLFTPYFTFIFSQMGEVLPGCSSVVGGYGIYEYRSRRCDNPHCRGLRKAMELDIQLETEQCVRTSLPIAHELPWNGGVELGQDPKELEAELRRMAPPNGRAVLIFRAPCGCPTARFEAWGSKKARRSKK